MLPSPPPLRTETDSVLVKELAVLQTLWFLASAYYEKSSAGEDSKSYTNSEVVDMTNYTALMRLHGLTLLEAELHSIAMAKLSVKPGAVFSAITANDGSLNSTLEVLKVAVEARKAVLEAALAEAADFHDKNSMTAEADSRRVDANEPAVRSRARELAPTVKAERNDVSEVGAASNEGGSDSNDVSDGDSNSNDESEGNSNTNDESDRDTEALAEASDKKPAVEKKAAHLHKPAKAQIANKTEVEETESGNELKDDKDEVKEEEDEEDEAEFVDSQSEIAQELEPPSSNPGVTFSPSQPLSTLKTVTTGSTPEVDPLSTPASQVPTPAPVGHTEATPVTTSPTVSPTALSAKDVSRSPPAEGGDRKRKSLTPLPHTSKRFQALAIQILGDISSNKYATMFLQLVNEKDAPGYYSCVRRPIDLKIMKQMVKKHEITSFTELERCLLLMFANAIMFNHEDSGTSTWTLQMIKEVDEILRLYDSALGQSE